MIGNRGGEMRYRYKYEVTKVNIDKNNNFPLGKIFYFYSKQPKRLKLNDRNLEVYVDVELKLIEKKPIESQKVF